MVKFILLDRNNQHCKDLLGIERPFQHSSNQECKECIREHHLKVILLQTLLSDTLKVKSIQLGNRSLEGKELGTKQDQGNSNRQDN
jgi:hypothetical protein